jgi:ubiquinone/menaquinone biosynthesis C-methylase UbiE
MDTEEQNNNKKFSEDIESFKVSYLRECEKHLAEKYMKGKILVLGCGAGRTLRPLKNMGFDLVGVDINEDMVAEAKKQNPDLKIYRGDASHLDFKDRTFDTVFFPFHGIDYVHPDIYVAVKEIERVLKPGGIFIMSSHNRFFIKKIKDLFKGNYSNYGGLVTYRTTYLDWFKLKKYFRKVKMIQRISILSARNWKDLMYKLFPILNKSTYFICFK